MRVQGRFLEDRVSANECIKVASERMALLTGEMFTRPDTPGDANRLNDYVRDVIKALRAAEKLLEQRGAN